MAKSLDDPVFGGRIAEVNEPLKYRVAFANQQSDWYSVKVFDFPALVRADAKLHFPRYSALEEKLLQDVRQISAVEGTEERKRRAFFTAYNQLHHRLSIFVSLPIEKLDRLSLQRRLDEIGKVVDRGSAA